MTRIAMLLGTAVLALGAIAPAAWAQPVCSDCERLCKAREKLCRQDELSNLKGNRAACFGRAAEDKDDCKGARAAQRGHCYTFACPGDVAFDTCRDEAAANFKVCMADAKAHKAICKQAFENDAEFFLRDCAIGLDNCLADCR